MRDDNREYGSGGTDARNFGVSLRRGG